MSRRKIVTAAKDKSVDQARFWRSWLERPLMTGAVAPSSPWLARAMASYVNSDIVGPVIELGPGTGPVTQALVRHGIPQNRLILVEYSADFCKLLKRRFPEATIIQGDAYNITDTLKGVLSEPAAAVVSSLPLMTKPLDTRVSLLNEATTLMAADAPFIQFTYALMPPIPEELPSHTCQASKRIWRNMPPARVWVYNQRSET
ncbi:phospholipid methyltransferase [Microvirga sp. W0021]|uniref:Phospholipid methyltransferase n=1 Tax=Hohaiivirga grylli TaxID=3133970 RepID=A0ABV0BHM1_9HYPH